VFSDSVFLPNGKSVAKEAKKLEKMKAEDYEYRFAKANQHIDSKLDNLFAYQEANKTEEPNSTGMEKGGLYPIKQDATRVEKRKSLPVKRQTWDEALNDSKSDVSLSTRLN